MSEPTKFGEEVRVPTAALLRNIRDDIKELEWRAVDDDTRELLIAKADVLEIINDWLDYVLSGEWHRDDSNAVAETPSDG